MDQVIQRKGHGSTTGLPAIAGLIGIKDEPLGSAAEGQDIKLGEIFERIEKEL